MALSTAQQAMVAELENQMKEFKTFYEASPVTMQNAGNGMFLTQFMSNMNAKIKQLKES